MNEDKEYPEIPRGATKTLADISALKLSMILVTLLMVVALLTSIRIEFEIGADGSKHVSIDFAREQSELPPEVKAVEPVRLMPPSDVETAAQYIAMARSFAEKDTAYDTVIRYCTRALELDPNNISAYVPRGRAYFYKERYTEALADLDKAIAADVPDLAVAYNARGCVYYALKEYKKALADLDEATRLDPNFAKPYKNRMLVYEALADVERAAARK